MSEIQDESTTQEKGITADLRQCRILNRNAALAGRVRYWWQLLALSPEEARQRQLPRPWSPGLRAALRRCQNPEAAALTEGFRRLWQMRMNVVAAEPDRHEIEAWACIAMVLAEINDDKPGISFASQAGCQKGKSGEPIVSSLRFQQLQKVRDSQELVRRLRRLLAMLRDQPISVVMLADDILLWFNENRRHYMAGQPTRSLAYRWAEAYFSQVAQYKTANA